MSEYTYSKKKAADGKQNNTRAVEGAKSEGISNSDMLHLSGAGAPQPMSPELREKFEPGFGADLSNIRISRGRIPDEMGIHAVAKGTDILVDSRAGNDVIGHELAHVVQQAQGRVEGGYPVVNNLALEREADVMGQRAASGLSAMEGGMGELAQIAPMSSATAPAQCKSKTEKALEKTKGEAKRVDSTPHALGPSTKMDALYGETDGVKNVASDLALAMDAANTPTATDSDVFQANGLRTTSDGSKAVKERGGTAYAGLSDDVNDYFKTLEGSGMDWEQVNKHTERGGGREGLFGGMGFKYGPEISQMSVGSMDIMEKYLERPEIQQHLRERNDLIENTNGAFGGSRGSELDFTMTDLMNREFGLGAFGQAKVERGDNNDETAKEGITSVNSFVTRLPNIVRDIESGKTKIEDVPEHMLPAIERYKAIRGKVGQMTSGADKYDPATGAKTGGTTTPPQQQPTVQPQPTPTISPQPGQQYVRPQDLPQSGPGWEHTGSKKVYKRMGLFNDADKDTPTEDLMPTLRPGYDPNPAQPQQPAKKKGFFSRLFGKK